MFTKHHIISGFVFAYIIYWFTSITIFQASLIFLSSVLIDFDHYIWYVQRKKDWSLKNAHYFFVRCCLKKIHSKKHKAMMMIFHSIEFLILIGILSFYFNIFLFILIGALFHSVLDVIYISYKDWWGAREFSLIRYLILKNKYPDKYL